MTQWKQASGLDLFDMLAAEAEASDERDRHQRRRAEAHASVTHALGAKVGELTPAQEAFAEKVANRRGGGETRYAGFSIPSRGRKPNVR